MVGGVVATTCEEHVLLLDVPMADAVGVHMHQRLRQLCHNAPGNALPSQQAGVSLGPATASVCVHM